MKTPTIRRASLAIGILATLALAACTSPYGGASGAPAGSAQPAASAPAASDATSPSPYDYGGSGSGAPADDYGGGSEYGTPAP
jgi:hypothetical protein